MHYIIGIDEAGRGPWAGPVVAGGFICPVDFDFSVFAPYLSDSKKMTEQQREDVFGRIEKVMESNIVRYHFAYREAQDIDALGIREANRQCMEEVILGLVQYTSDSDIIHILIDGCDNYTFGIEGFDYILAKKKRKKDTHTPDISKYKTSSTEKIDKISPIIQNIENPIISTPLPHNSISYIIHGDTLSPAISAASVVAKVTRDRMMCDFHEDFPGYGFDSHKGYGTRKHHEAMMNYGITPIHRKSYAPVKSLILGRSSV